MGTLAPEPTSKPPAALHKQRLHKFLNPTGIRAPESTSARPAARYERHWHMCIHFTGSHGAAVDLKNACVMTRAAHPDMYLPHMSHMSTCHEVIAHEESDESDPLPIWVHPTALATMALTSEGVPA